MLHLTKQRKCLRLSQALMRSPHIAIYTFYVASLCCSLTFALGTGSAFAGGIDGRHHSGRYGLRTRYCSLVWRRGSFTIETGLLYPGRGSIRLVSVGCARNVAPGKLLGNTDLMSNIARMWMRLPGSPS